MIMSMANQTHNQLIYRQLNENSHWPLLRVGTPEKPHLDFMNKLVFRDARVMEVNININICSIDDGKKLKYDTITR